MERVRVLVVAYPNKGKTTIASIIKEALESWGFEKVVLKDIPSSPPEMKRPIHERIEATKRRPVEIEVIPEDRVWGHLREIDEAIEELKRQKADLLQGAPR